MRIAGADRYATAAAISRDTFSPGVPVAYLTTGIDFPDAVSAGASAAEEGGPVLLTRPDSIPGATRSELERLAPAQIVLVGGEAAISASVELGLHAYAPTVRVAGADRYATAVVVSQRVFTAGADVVFITTGLAFPDALAAGAAAGSLGGPVLLVQPDFIPESVRWELTRLAPTQIVIVGGTAVVGSSLEDELAAYASQGVTRLAGSDRFATAAAVAEEVFPANIRSRVFVATGAEFADGLAAVPAAVAAGVPVLLVEPERVPSATRQTLTRLAPRSVALLGGKAAVSDLVRTDLAAIVSAAGGYEPPITAGPFLVAGPNAAVPLVATLSLETSVPTRIRLDLVAESTTLTRTFDELATRHDLPVLGLMPGETTTVTVTVIDGSGAETTSNAVLVTTRDPLPEDFPSLTIETQPSSATEPGVTLFDVTRLNSSLGSFLVIVDDAGRVLWYLDSPDRILDTRRLGNGNLLIGFTNRADLVEIDMMGNEVRVWHASNRATGSSGSIPVAVDSFHHEVYPVGGDSFLGLSSEVRSIPDFPTSETDSTPRPEPSNIAGDVVFEFAGDGTVTNRWSLLDLLDPIRIGYDSFGGFWNSIYPELSPTFDWAHANGVIRDPSDGGIIVSLRHQDAVVKFMPTGDLVWILGPHENWRPPWDAYLLAPVGSDFAWPYHPHAPMLTGSGSLVLFDNGVHGVSPPDPPLTDTTSRAVEYVVDSAAMTVEQVWQYDPGIFARVLGDADALADTGNVLATFGNIVGIVEGEPSARIIEVTRAAAPVVAWQLTVDDDNPGGTASRVVYRSERLPGLYP